MANPSRRRRARLGIGAVSLAAVLAACGGGEILALLQIVTPLAGQWSDSTSNESINFLTPPPDQAVFLSQTDVTASVSSATGVCGDTTNASVNVVGRLDNGKLTLRTSAAASPCVQGSFVDLRRFDALALGAAPARSYFNSRVDVRLPTGLWASANGSLKLKFTDPFSVDNNALVDTTGCDVSGVTKVAFKGSLQGFSTTTLARPTIAELRNTGTNALMFSAVEFVDGATLKLLNSIGQSVTLTRQADPANTTC